MIKFLAGILALLIGPLLADAAENRAGNGPATPTSTNLAEPKSNRHGSPRDRFQSARSFYTYYGAGKVAELSHYDVAILHTPQMPSAEVKWLSKLGVVTIGYVTIGEDEKLQTGNGKGPGGKASWYFDQDQDEQPDQDPIWKSWYANTNDPLWRASRVEVAKQLVDEYGFDGIFLDLISVSEMYPECRPGMIAMMRDLRTALPNAVIVMNQGFDIVGDVAPLADGFMIESFTATYDFEKKQYVLNDAASLDFHLNRAQKLLNPAIGKNPLRVLVLDYAKPTDRENLEHAANRAASLGYLFSASPILLDDVYPDVPVGKADAKWLRRHSSPERLAWKLPESRNGFPIGAIVTPSGNFAGYSVESMFSATDADVRNHWSKAAWASGEDGMGAWLKIALPAPHSGGELEVAWHDSSGPSRDFAVQVRDEKSAPWRDVDSRQGNQERVTRHPLPQTPFRQLRIVQPPGGGSVGRPQLMWISKLELSN